MKKIPSKPFKNKISPSAIAPQLSDKRFNYLAFYLLLIAILLVINVLFQQGGAGEVIQRSWGLNNFSYFPVWAQVVVFLLLFSAAIPAINTWLITLFARLSGAIATKPMKMRDRIVTFLWISLLLDVLLFVFKIKYDLLGDRDTRVGQAVKAIYVHDEYLTMVILHYLYLMMHGLFNFSPHRTFVFHSIASGFCYFFMGLLISDLLFDNRKNKIIFYLFYISAGIIMVFSGYVEIYAFPAASVSLYIYLCLLFLKGKTNIVLPLLALLLAIALHLEQVSLIPSFVFLIVWKQKFMDRVNILVPVALILLAIPVIYIANAILKIDPPPVVYLTTNHLHSGLYTLLSFSHFWEFFNSQFLSSGMLVFLFPVTLIILYNKGIKLDEVSKLLLIIALFSIVIVFTANTMLGSADWDICSFPSISVAMFVAYVLLTQFKQVYTSPKITYILSVALLFNTLNCWAWIGINSSDRSVKKVCDMLSTDPGYFYQVYLPAELQLTTAFYHDGLVKEATDIAMQGYDKYGKTSAKAAYNKITMQLINKDSAGAITTLEEMVNDFPMVESDIQELTILYESRHMYMQEYKLGLKIEDLYTKTPRKVAQALGTGYLRAMFNYLHVNAQAQKDTLTYKRSQYLLNSLMPTSPTR